MTLKEQLNADLRDAMRANDETRRSTLRLLLTAVRNAEIPPEPAAGASADTAQRRELDDATVLELIKREVKQRRDSIDAYTKANRADLVAREEAEVAVLSAYMPPQMSRADIEKAVRAVIDRLGATGPADKGKVMPVIMAELKDQAEGREINAVVTEMLSNK